MAQQYYEQAALCDCMVTVEECANVLLNMNVPHSMGFTADVALGLNAKKLTVASDIVQAQSTNAYHLLHLFVRLAFHRVASMMYHTCGQGMTDDLAAATMRHVTGLSLT